MKHKNKAGKISGMNRSSLKDEYAKISYSVGYQVGGDFKRQKLTIYPEAFLTGIQDALEGNELIMNREELQNVLLNLKKTIMGSEQKEKKKAAEKNLTEGRAFLIKNAKKRGVKTLESGLHYRGNLIDGKEFDSSYKRSEPATFRADSCIRGWGEALQMMEERAKWKLFIPPDQAYGERGAGLISPNSTLVFNLELISVRSSKQR